MRGLTTGGEKLEESRLPGGPSEDLWTKPVDGQDLGRSRLGVLADQMLGQLSSVATRSPPKMGSKPRKGSADIQANSAHADARVLAGSVMRGAMRRSFKLVRN